MSDTAASAFPLATSTWDGAEIDAIHRVIASDRYTMGPRVAEFERSFARAFGSEFAVMVNSGSSANLIAIAAAVLDPTIDLAPGDDVIVPAVSWATTYYPLAQYGLRPNFVDIDINTLNLDLELVEAAITPRTKAIFAVNLLGNPNDFTRMLEIAERHSLIVIEDNCESLGAEFDGRAAGTFGIMGTFSSFFSHHISTMEGGLVLTDDERLAQMLTSLRAHGWTRELPAVNAVHDKTGDEFDDLFRFVLPGYNVRPLEMSGAIGLEQLKKVPAIIAGRRENALLFHEAIGDLEGIRLQREVGSSSWFGFSMIFDGPYRGRRREIVAAFTAASIDCRPIVAGNFTRNPVMAHLDAIVPDRLPAADAAHDDGLFVGNHHYPIQAELQLLRDTLLTVRG